MKKIFLVIISLIIIFSLSSCKKTSDTDSSTYSDIASDTAAKAKEIQSISISTLPEDAKLTRYYTSYEKIDLIRAYIDSLTLEDIHSENPDSYNGLIYNVSVTYDDNSVKVYSNLENKFFKVGDLEWKRLNYEQAIELDKIIINTPSD